MPGGHTAFLGKLRAAIARAGLLRRGDRVLAAVSGGADSVALLQALVALARRLGITVIAAHLDHGIRGRASAEDADFVRRLGRSLGIRLVCGRRAVPRLARKTGLSLEMVARAVRYRFLTAAARRVGATVIATAHTADDQVETVIMRMARGCGLRGLTGIPRETSMNGIRIVRPLLDFSRSEINKYLASIGAEWREDESNRDPAFMRNRVRHEILPLLEQRLNPGIRAAILRMTDILREDENWLDELSRAALAACTLQTSRAGDTAGLDVAALAALPRAARRRVLRLWLRQSGVAEDELGLEEVDSVENLLRRKGTRHGLALAGKWRVWRDGGQLRVTLQPEPLRSLPQIKRREVPVPGEIVLAPLGLRVRAWKGAGVAKPARQVIGQWPARASLNLAALGRRKLIVRVWQRGDRIRPLGMTGTKKLQDIFVDAKVPAAVRKTIPIFECGGEIVWVPGYRIARGWEVSADAGQALQLAVEAAP